MSEHRDAIRSRLNEMFYDLVINDQFQIAHKTLITDDQNRGLPRLSSDRSMDKYDTICLFTLRQALRAEQESEDVYITKKQVREQVQMYLSLDETNLARREVEIDNGIKTMIAYGLMHKRHGEPDTDTTPYRILRGLEALMGYEQLLELSQTLSNAIAPEDDPDDDTGNDDTDGDGGLSMSATEDADNAVDDVNDEDGEVFDYHTL